MDRQKVTILPADEPERVKLGWTVYEQQYGESHDDFVKRHEADIDLTKYGKGKEKVLTKIGYFVFRQLKDESDEDFRARIKKEVEDINSRVRDKGANEL